MAVLHSGAVQADTGATVRLSFPQGVHPDVTVQPGEMTIGSAPDNRVVLKGAGVRPHHASIVVDPRGFTLFVKTPDAHTHVNARPVREKAILRLGDVVSIDNVNMILKPIYDESVRGNKPGPSSAISGETRVTPPRVVLRGVSGPYFGKVVPINGKLTIGRGNDCDLVLDEPEMSRKHATIEVAGAEIVLRDHGSANGTYVNGVQVHDVSLYTGDQLAFDRNRFLIEAPGTPMRKAETKPVGADTPPEPKARVEVTQTMRAIRPQEAQQAQQAAAQAQPAARTVSPAPRPAPRVASRPAPAPAKGFNPWWLLVAAALIAAGIAAMLLR